jgi:hypothetical protein
LKLSYWLIPTKYFFPIYFKAFTYFHPQKVLHFLPLPPYKEKELLRALTQYDWLAYTTLYSQHLDALVQYILLFTGSQETAEEITQDVFLKI